jgi:predicted TIM-barrel fold metal-dependent hydrolase
MPPGACDCHCHIFGPKSCYPFVAGRSYTPREAPLGSYRRMRADLGLTRTVVVQPSVYGYDNACTEDAVRDLGASARGVAVIPTVTEEREIARLQDAGFRGARLNLVQSGDPEALAGLEELAARIAPFGWHLQIYARAQLLAELLPRLRRLPVDLVIDHLGHPEIPEGVAQPGFEALLELVEGGRCWVKLCAYIADHSGPPYLGARPFIDALAERAPHRLVWGSNWPHPVVEGPRPVDVALLDALGTWFPDEGRIREILVDNPAELYGFPGASGS